MTTFPPPPEIPPDFGHKGGSNTVVVYLTGINPKSQTPEFSAQIQVDLQPVEYRAVRVFGVDEALELAIAVGFPNRKPMQASASVTGFLSIKFTRKYPTRLDADIEHSVSKKKKCHLLCFEDGSSSDGPCLTCPDGEYQIRICC